MKTQIREIESTRFLLNFHIIHRVANGWFPLDGSSRIIQMDDFHWMGLVESAIHLLVCPAKSIQVIINKPKDHRLIKIHHKQQLTQSLDFGTQLGLPNQPRIPLVKGIGPNFALFVNYDGWDPIIIIIHYRSHDVILEVSGCNHGYIAGLYEDPNLHSMFLFSTNKMGKFWFF